MLTIPYGECVDVCAGFFHHSPFCMVSMCDFYKSAFVLILVDASRPASFLRGREFGSSSGCSVLGVPLLGTALFMWAVQSVGGVWPLYVDPYAL